MLLRPGVDGSRSCLFGGREGASSFFPDMPQHERKTRAHFAASLILRRRACRMPKFIEDTVAVARQSKERSSSSSSHGLMPVLCDLGRVTSAVCPALCSVCLVAFACCHEYYHLLLWRDCYK